MMTSSPFMDDYSSEDYNSSSDYEDLDGYCCVLPKATTPHNINIITQPPIHDESLESNESSHPQIVTRLDVAAPDSLSSLSDHHVLPVTVCCLELADDAALEAAENVVVEEDTMTEESSEAVMMRAASAVEDGDAMPESESFANIAMEVEAAKTALEIPVTAIIEECYAEAVEESVEAAVALALEIPFAAMIEEVSEAVEADAAIENTDVEDGDAMIEEPFANYTVQADDDREAKLAVEEGIYAMIDESAEAALDAVEEPDSKAVEADSLVEPEDAAVQESAKAVESAVALELEIAVDAMIKEPPVIDMQDYSSEGDDSNQDHSTDGDASEDYSSEGDAISVSSEYSVDFEDYCVQVEIDMEEYDSSELDSIDDYASGDVTDEFFSEGDASEDYSSEDSLEFEDYFLKGKIDHVIEWYSDSSELDSIEAGEDVMDELSLQGVSIQEYCSEGERDPSKDYFQVYVDLENYCAQGDYDAPSRSEIAILVQAMLDWSTIPPLFSLQNCLSILKSCMNNFLRFGHRLRSIISALFCKVPVVDKYV